MKLSFIILNYNVTDLLRNCISSIEKFAQNIDYEIIVIDNNSPDTSWKNLISEFPKVIFIENPENEGFAKANNKAVSKARGEYIFLLNPDTELEENYFEEILNFADSKRNFGSLGLRMHDADGKFLPESKRSIPNAVNSFEKLFLNFKKNNTKSYYRYDIGEFEIAKVEVLTGANLLVKREIYEQIGGMDERYFMYGEDIDFCYTLLQNGFENWYFGKYSILHLKGESTVKDKIYLERFYGAMQLFIDKYYKKKNIVQYFLLSFGLQIRHKLELIKLSIKKST